MPEQPRHWVVKTGLLTLFAFALAGLGCLAIGIFGHSTGLIVLGAVVFGASIAGHLTVYLANHVGAAPNVPMPRANAPGWDYVPTSTVHASNHAEAAPEEPENFTHLMGHTLERVEAPAPVAAPQPRPEPPRRMMVAPRGEWAEAEPLPKPPRYQKSDIVPAVQRRQDIVRDLPILREVLAEETPTVTAGANGQTKGQCSGCSATLYAPAARPIRLTCPKCGRSATLEA